MATQNKQLARELLLAKPELAKALFQVLLHFFLYQSKVVVILMQDKLERRG